MTITNHTPECTEQKKTVERNVEVLSTGKLRMNFKVVTGIH